MEFRLHNEEGIQFPQINPAYQEDELFFERFRALIPRDSKDSVIGEGGTGLIHLVRDELMDRIVALKLPHESIARDPSARGDVIRETRQAIDLTHPNIVRIHDFHEGHEGWGISMQYVQGRNLDEWRHVGAPSGVSRSIAPYHVDRIEDWVVQLCNALTYAHEDAKMVHRDIKPKNLMLQRFDNGYEKLLLTDFGITQKLRLHTMMLSRVQPERQDNTAAGTLPYMPWSQIDGESASVLDDIYAVGATIYDLLTGRPPFYEGGYEQIRHQIENSVPPSMEERLQEFDIPSSGIPKKWEDVVAACLAKDPADRPQSTKEIIARLGLGGASVAIAAPAAPDPELENKLKEAQENITRLTSENQQLNELLASGGDQSTELLSQIETLKTQIQERDSSIGEWQTAYAKLEESSSADDDEVLTELKASLAKKEQELSTQLDKSKTLEEQAAQFQKRLTEEESKLAGLQGEISQSNQAKEKALAQSEKATATIQSLTEKAKAAEKQASELKGRQSAPLMPLLYLLLGATLVGAVGGGVLGKVTAPKVEAIALAEVSFSSQIPATVGDSGELVKTSLFLQYLREAGASEAFIDQHFQELTELDPDEPAVGISFATATRFCGWLTARLKNDLDENSFYRVSATNEILGKRESEDPPEWSIDLFLDDKTKSTIGQQVMGTNEQEAKFRNISSATTLADNPRGIGFRVTLAEER